MSVAGSQKTIFCEGKNKSIDYKLLNQIVDGVQGERPTIVQAGGKFTFSIFAEGYFGDELEDKRYLIFRDRDFDVEPDEVVRLLELKKMFLTHRACVENYLIDAGLIHDYWCEKYNEKIENPSSKWGHGDSPGVTEISSWIENSARSLLFYQAARWSLGKLLGSGDARKHLKTTWVSGGSGHLPQYLDLESCREKAMTLINEFREAVDTVTREKFDEYFASFQHEFKTPEFWENKQYLVWFHGKDVQKEMQRQRAHFISLGHFFEWAAARIDIEKYPDLIELKRKIEEM